MDDKTALVQIRVEQNLKDEFYKLAERLGQAPSILLRSLMRQAIEQNSASVDEIKQRQSEFESYLYELIGVVQRQSFVGPEAQWHEYRQSFLPEYLTELTLDTVKAIGLDGDDLWDRYWAEIDKNWFTNHRAERPLISVHNQRDRMDTTRKALLRNESIPAIEDNSKDQNSHGKKNKQRGPDRSRRGGSRSQRRGEATD